MTCLPALRPAFLFSGVAEAGEGAPSGPLLSSEPADRSPRWVTSEAFMVAQALRRVPGLRLQHEGAPDCTVRGPLGTACVVKLDRRESDGRGLPAWAEGAKC